jgi:hypothetical protein
LFSTIIYRNKKSKKIIVIKICKFVLASHRWRDLPEAIKIRTRKKYEEFEM